jgi:hypothetical protein
LSSTQPVGSTRFTPRASSAKRRSGAACARIDWLSSVWPSSALISGIQ